MFKFKHEPAWLFGFGVFFTIYGNNRSKHPVTLTALAPSALSNLSLKNKIQHSTKQQLVSTLNTKKDLPLRPEPFYDLPVSIFWTMSPDQNAAIEQFCVLYVQRRGPMSSLYEISAHDNTWRLVNLRLGEVFTVNGKANFNCMSTAQTSIHLLGALLHTLFRVFSRERYH